MKNKTQRIISLLLAVLMMTIFSSSLLHAGVPATTVKFTVTDLKVTSSPIEEENYFTVEATYKASITNHGWDSTVWHQCSSCGGAGKTHRYGDSDGNTIEATLTCGQTFEGRTWMCRDDCDGFDYQDNNDMWGEVTHDTTDPWDGEHTNNWDDGKPHIWDKESAVTCTCSMEVEITDAVANDGLIPCRGCAGIGSIFNGMTDCSSCDFDTQGECMACAGTGAIASFSPCAECDASGRVTEFIDCEACGGSGGNFVTIHYDPVEPTSDISTQITIALDGNIQETKDVTFDLSTTVQDGYTWTKEGYLVVEWTVFSEEDIGTKNVETTIDGGDEEGERMDINVEVLPACNLTVDFITPNAYYRNDTEVISTFKISNFNSELGLDVRPKHQLTAKLTVKNKLTGEVIATSSKKDIVIPKGKSNIVYFKWKVPKDFDFGGEDAQNAILQCDINTGYVTNSYGVNEDNYEDNTSIVEHKVQNFDVMSTPDTQFEKRAPNWFKPPTDSDTVEYDRFAQSILGTSSFSEWVYKGDAYELKKYDLSLTSTQKTTPDINSHSAKEEDGMYTVRSGYGLETKVDSKTTTNAPGTAYTIPQNATMHLPEYKYSSQDNKFRTLARQESSFIFNENKYAKNDKGKVDNRPIHFVPLYYYDGNYEMKSYVFDLWTPMGMLSAVADDKVALDGDMYDDWYVGH